MPEYDVLPEINSFEDRQRLADIARIYDAARRGEVPLTKPIAGVLAASGLSMSVSAQPDRDDSYPEVGLVNDRVDGWANGVDANHTYAGQMGQGVSNIGTIGTYTILPENGNAQQITVNGDSTFDVGSVPGSKRGYSISVLFEGGTDASVSWDSSITFDSNGTTPSNIGDNEFFIVGFRTYDGGSTWNANVTIVNELYHEGEEEEDWTLSSEIGSVSKNSDNLEIEISTSLTTGGAAQTDHQVDFSQYHTAVVERDLSTDGQVAINFEYGSGNTIRSDSFSSDFSRQPFEYDLSSVTSTADVRDEILNESTSSTTNATMRIYSVKFYG